MMKQLIVSVGATAVLLSPIASARSIDDYGRNLQSHEELGGHTKERHVSKSYA